MYAQRPEARPATVEVLVDGQAIRVPEGASAAAAVLVAGLPALRSTPVGGAPRAPYCMMGVCFECLVEIDGRQNQQACLTPAQDGMVVRRQIGARQLP